MPSSELSGFPSPSSRAGRSPTLRFVPVFCTTKSQSEKRSAPSITISSAPLSGTRSVGGVDAEGSEGGRIVREKRARSEVREKGEAEGKKGGHSLRGVPAMKMGAGAPGTFDRGFRFFSRNLGGTS